MMSAIVLLLDGNSEIGAQEWNDLGYLIWLHREQAKIWDFSLEDICFTSNMRSVLLVTI